MDSFTKAPGTGLHDRGREMIKTNKLSFIVQDKDKEELFESTVHSISTDLLEIYQT